MLNASPSAHDQSAAALRRPPARHLAALRLFLEAQLFAQSPPNRWISLVGKNIGKNTPGGKLDALLNQLLSTEETSLSLVFVSRILLHGELNAVCAGLRFFPPK